MATDNFIEAYDLRTYNADLKDKPFELLADVIFETDAGRIITAPKGYRTDFASVPRFFHRVIPPMGRHGKASIIHDWLCDESPKTTDYREAADIFNQAMLALGVSNLRRKLMVAAVKLGGPKFQKGDL